MMLLLLLLLLFCLPLVVTLDRHTVDDEHVVVVCENRRLRTRAARALLLAIRDCITLGSQSATTKLWGCFFYENVEEENTKLVMMKREKRMSVCLLFICK